MAELTHTNDHGKARMVNIADKEPTHRIAEASAIVQMKPEIVEMIRLNNIAKGDVLAVAKTAGIMAAKNTSNLIPLCHPISLSIIDIEFNIEPSRVLIKSRVEAIDRTGVEMEAMMAVSVAALTIYDMCKAADKAIEIEVIRLEKKSGGKSGKFSRIEQ